MSTPELEYIGVLGRTHGLDGTLLLTDAILLPSALHAGATVHIGYSREFTTAFAVAEHIQKSGHTYLRLQQIQTSEAASELVDQAVYASAADVGMSQSNRFRIGDIEGCCVVTEAGTSVGTITEVWILPANDVWVVTTAENATIPLPVIDDVVKSVDIANRVITVHLLEGLADIDSNDDNESDA